MPDYERIAGLSPDVVSDLPTPKDLHNRFIPGSLIPHGQSSSDSGTIELTIDNDYTMHLGEHEIVLGGLEIYVFNTLLLLRDRQPTASELRSLGFGTTSSSPAAVRKAFRNAYELLAEQLNANGNQPLVTAEGDEPESAHYSLNPNLIVTDRRTHEAQVAPTPPSRTALDFLIDHGTRSEKEKAGPRGELYARLVTLDRLPSAPLPQTGSPIEVAIVDNTTLRVGDKLIRLGPHERYLFNALMLRRDGQSAASELKSFGFYPGAKEAAANTAFYKATQGLSGRLNGAAGTEVIAKFGQKRGSRYAVNPNLLLRDLRSEEDLAREVVDLKYKPGGRINPDFTKRPELISAGNLYSRLIDLDRIPAVPRREGSIPIELAILDNTTLRIGDHDVRLSTHQRYLFNALMLLRDQSNAARDLKAFGFYRGAKPSTTNVAFSNLVNSLRDQLNSAAGVEILKKIGQKRSTRYIVNPNLLLTDLRTDEDRAAEIVEESKRSRSSNPDRTRSEFRELTTEGDLYERIVDIERIPPMDVNDGTSIQLLIDDNTTLRVGGHLIKLGRHERYLFNALMLLRGNPASGKELRQFGFLPGAAQGTASMTFSKAMTNLIKQINEALGVEVFKKIGERRNMLYAVNPNMVFNDLRTDDDKKKEVVDVAPRRGRPSKYPELEEGYMPNGKRSNYKGPVYEGYGADAEHYDDNERRTLLITELVQRYKDHPQVQEALHKLNNGAPIQVGPEQPYYRYLAEICQYDLLDPDDEVRLFKILENGVNLYKDWGAHEDNEQALIDAVIARQIVYLSNLRLVVEYAKHWAAYSKTMGRLDYIQEGNIGLADAIDRFDHTRGFRFSTYATWWVKQAIQRSQADKDRLIRIPVHMHDRLVGFSKTVRELTNELNREPNPWEIANKLNESVADVLKLQGYIRMEPASLNALIEDSGKGSRMGVRERIDQIADPNDEIAQATQEAEDTAVVEALFSKRNLTLPEKYVVSFRLGFVVESLRGTVLEYTDGTVVHYDDLVAVMTDPEVRNNTLEEAGQLFGVTRERIRQIEKNGLDKIRLTYGRK